MVHLLMASLSLKFNLYFLKIFIGTVGPITLRYIDSSCNFDHFCPQLFVYESHDPLELLNLKIGNSAILLFQLHSMTTS